MQRNTIEEAKTNQQQRELAAIEFEIEWILISAAVRSISDITNSENYFFCFLQNDVSTVEI